MLNLFFGVKISDAHCGMRATVRKDALPTLDLHSTGMEFASEMVFKAFRREAARRRDPDRLLPARRRVEAEPLRRRLAPREVHAPLQPELAVLRPGARPARPRRRSGPSPLATGPVTLLGRTWQIHTLFACIARRSCSASQIVQLGIFARAFAAAHLGETDTLIERAHGRLSLEHGLVLGLGLLVAGVVTVDRRSSSAGRSTASAALSHEYATAIGFTLDRARDAGDTRLVLPEPPDDAHHRAVARHGSSRALPVA